MVGIKQPIDRLFVAILLGLAISLIRSYQLLRENKDRVHN